MTAKLAKYLQTLQNVFAVNFCENGKIIKFIEQSKKATPAVAIQNRYIFVAGGMENFEYSTSEVELYDIDANVWTTLASMQASRALFGLVEANGSLYALGNSVALPVEMFDPIKHGWVKVDAFQLQLSPSKIQYMRWAEMVNY